MAPRASLETAESLVENVNVLRQANGVGLLPLIDAISKTSLSLVEVNKSRAKPDPSDELLEQKRNILWGTFQPDVQDTASNVKDRAHLLSDRMGRAEAAETHRPKKTMRLDWLAELPSRDHAPHPIRRFFPVVAVMGLLLLAGLAWSILRPSSELLSQAPNIAPQNSSGRLTPVTYVKPRIFGQKLESVEPSTKTRRASSLRNSGNHSAVSIREHRLDLKVKRMQRERDAALALSQSSERKRQSLLAAADARERAQAAEHEAELARDRERVNQLAFAVEKARQEARAAKVAVLAQQKRPELETPPQSAVPANTAASKPADVSQPSQSADTKAGAGEDNSEPTLFTANPCKGPSARFLSTCE